jgi:ArsR family metal-binding transcriptional regulator
MAAMNELIKDYNFELVEDFHTPGSGHYSVRITLSNDISEVFPYLNREFDDTLYDHENKIFIGAVNRKRYAFRPNEIQAGAANDHTDAGNTADEIVKLVNQIWEKRDTITPSYRERKKPPVYEIFKLLPKTNCKRCDCPTCLAFAGKLRKGEVPLEQCPLLTQEEHTNLRTQIEALFADD